MPVYALGLGPHSGHIDGVGNQEGRLITLRKHRAYLVQGFEGVEVAPIAVAKLLQAH
ncbi:hypothetical protein PP1Y_AT34824 [Novosphingobium sp. PP1Y]|nr:hypothetical protein PP1Y_AT34824 [Novosphingobium sp. PP1Y]